MLYARLEQVLAPRGVRREAGPRLLVACSGGPDSVALAHVASKLFGPSRVALGHVDHGVRPGSSQDAAAVLAFAAQLGCEARAARLEGVADSEAALRHARYAALERMRADVDAAFVLTAHTADDQAETVLLALLSRTHADALSGMPEQREAILRPWLTVSRAEVHAHAARHRLPARVDPSNREPRYLRNRVRKELLPLIESRYRPGFSARLAALAAELGAPPAAPEPTRGLARAPGPEAAPTPAVRISRRAWDPAIDSIPDGPRSVVFDAEGIEGLVLRPLARGDRIQPFGHGRGRKVRDVLREAGIAEPERGLWQVVADDADRVLWVPGLLRASHAPIGEKTRNVWLCEVDRKDELRGAASRATLDAAAAGVYLAGREKSE